MFRKFLVFAILFAVSIVSANSQEQFFSKTIDAVGGYAYCLETDGEYAIYVGRGNSIAVYDITNEEQMVETVRIPLPGSPRDLQIVGDKLYIITFEAHLIVLSIEDPQAPYILTEYIVHPEANPYSLYINADYAYVALRHKGFAVYNISNLDKITKVFEDSNEAVNEVNGQGNYIYTMDLEDNFCIWDISNPDTPDKKSTVKLEDGYDKIYLHGNYAFLYDGYKAGIQIYDITNKTTPAFETSINNPENTVMDMFIENNRMFISSSLGYSDELVQLYDFSAGFDNMTLISELDLRKAISIKKVDNYLYALASSSDFFLRKVDYSDAQEPSIMEYLRGPNSINAMASDGDQLFYYSHSYTWQYDVSDPMNEKYVTRYYWDDVPWQSYVDWMEADDNKLYVLRTKKLYIADVTNPEEPVFSENTYPYELGDVKFVARDGIVYSLASGQGWHLDIVDARDMNNPVRAYKEEMFCWDVAAPEGSNYVYIGFSMENILDINKGILVMDASDPTNPIKVAAVETRGMWQSIAIDGDMMYVASNASDMDNKTNYYVDVFDIANPEQPKKVAEYMNSGYALSCVAKNRQIAVMKLDEGVDILEFPDSKVQKDKGDNPQYDPLILMGVLLARNGGFSKMYFDAVTSYIILYYVDATSTYPPWEVTGGGGLKKVITGKKPEGDVLLYTKVVPKGAAEAGASVSPSNISAHEKNSTASIQATNKGDWKFKKWVGDASGTNKTTSVMMDDDKFVYAKFAIQKEIPEFVLGVQEEEKIYCPYEATYVMEEVPIMKMSVTVNDVCEWDFQSISIFPNEDVDEKYVEKVILRQGHPPAVGSVIAEISFDNTLGLGFNVGKRLLPGEVFNFTMYYVFSDDLDCPMEDFLTFNAKTQITHVSAVPDIPEGNDYSMLPPQEQASGNKTFYCIEDKKIGKKYADKYILEDMQEESDIVYCPGTYEDVNLFIDKLNVKVTGTYINEEINTTIVPKFSSPIQILASPATIKDIIFDNISLIGAPAINLDRSPGSKIDGCKFRNLQYSILMKKSLDLTIENSEFIGGQAIYSEIGANIDINNCSFILMEEMSNNNLLKLKQITQLTINDCVFSGSSSIDDIGLKLIDIDILNVNNSKFEYFDRGIDIRDYRNSSINTSIFTENNTGIYTPFSGFGETKEKLLIRRNKFTSNESGVYLMSSANVISNLFANNNVGMRSGNINYGSLYAINSFRNNKSDFGRTQKTNDKPQFNDQFGGAMIFEGESSPNVLKNNISENEYGIIINEDAEPRINSNNFENNTNSAIDNMSNAYTIIANGNYFTESEKLTGQIDNQAPLDSPLGLVVESEDDTLYFPEPGNYSATFYFQNWLDSDDNHAGTLSESKDWITSSKNHTGTIEDETGGEIVCEFTIPDFDNEIENYITYSAVSNVDQTWQDEATIHIIGYIPEYSGLDLQPSHSDIYPDMNDEIQFDVINIDQHNNAMESIDITYNWSATGGNIDNTGLFQATETGDFEVTVEDPTTGFIAKATVTVHEQSNVQEFEIEQIGVDISPNPFNYSCRVDFNISYPSRTSIDVYNSLGEKVASIFDEFTREGRYQAEFHANNLPSGMYTIVITSGKSITTKRVMLVK